MMNEQNRAKVIISTVGTSLLTNQINRETERDWFKQLSNHANLTWDNLPNSVKEIIEELKFRASEQLKQNNLKKIRQASAELNGVFGIYDNDLTTGKVDLHYLIATDTAQGQATAEIVQAFLLQRGLSVNIYTPSGLSTANTSAFSEGIDQLIVWLREEIVKNYRGGYKIYFNLVGGFKSLQGYLNTLAMFYADAIAYIFEGENSELITIPRLPISIDHSVIEIYKVPLALMSNGAELSVSEVGGIPESLVYAVDGVLILSTWGKLFWGECKDEFLSGDLLEFKGLVYLDSFLQDYKKAKNPLQRIQLQNTLAKVCCFLEKSGGDTAILRGNNAGGILYDSYTGKYSQYDHFRVSLNWRVSCVAKEGVLYLRHFGEHDDVNNNP
ncbi:CRISPR-associated protein, APE2256 family (plasmid) [Gloeothece citriformis PCC 7424]|uniref:CRISPR-associated protein, APE2256 family n=1 Tax=Gloeothece citriformis (strain PCC 7424) TaxID=65393 RepID=B7KM73_GLOC7|nr:putative CRISPR-associated protein [Gloeothece citriformis]ACK73895.1 CRISPR-associated protein, APE2256 family [Gloeothece citriformis PCC 7424]